MKYLIILLSMITISAEPVKRTQVLMGTYATITLPSLHAKEITNGFNILRDIEMSLSSYQPEAKVYQLNLTKKIDKDFYLLEIIRKSKELYYLTNGYFDITIGSLTKKLYHFGEDEQIPTKAQIEDAKLDIKGVSTKGKNITLDKGITIDLGGIAKGYGVDKVAMYYKTKGIQEGIIALSGDIRVINPSEIFIESASKNSPNFRLKTLSENTSISTSGTYRRFIKNSSNHHLINPKTKKQGRDFVSISLFTIDNNTLIDAFATAVGAMSELEALRLLLNHPEIGFILQKTDGNIIYGNLDNLVKYDSL